METPQPQSEFSFSLGDLVAIAKRRFWWFGVPALLGATAGLAIALAWPAEYEAASLIMVEPQGVPEQLVASTVSSDTEARYGHIKLLILARDNLAAIIDEFELYADQVATTPKEELVEMMRNDITIEPLPPAIVDPRKPMEIESFRIAFRADQPKTCAVVANRLTRDFLSANLRERTTMAEGTSEFIDAQLVKSEEERARLLAELMIYSQEHEGELPQDLASNQARMEGFEQLLRHRDSELEMAQGRVTKIKEQVRQMREHGTDDSSDPVARKQALELAINLFSAQGKTAKHPDVLIASTELAQLEVILAEQLDSEAPLTRAESALRAEQRNYEVQISVLLNQIASVHERKVEIQDHISATPARAAQVTQLQANIVGLTEQIRDLQKKKIAADLGESVEMVQKGEKFRVVETAVPPTAPIFPNRPLFFVVGFVIGVGIGMFLLVVREMTDSSFHSIQDLQSTLELPVLGAIPVIRLPAEIARARARLRRLAIAGVTILALAAGGGLLVYLFSNVEGDGEVEAARRLPQPGERTHV